MAGRETDPPASALRAGELRNAAGRRLGGKVAFVTGASRGIGAAIARRFGAEGAKVALAARDLALCEKIASEIRAAGGEAVGIEGDIRGAIESAVAFAEASPFPLPEQATDDVFSA